MKLKSVIFLLLLILIIGCTHERILSKEAPSSEQPIPTTYIPDKAFEDEVPNVFLDETDNSEPLQKPEIKKQMPFDIREVRLNAEFGDGIKISKVFASDKVQAYLFNNGDFKIFASGFTEIGFLSFEITIDKQTLETKQASLRLGQNEEIILRDYHYVDRFNNVIPGAKFNIGGAYSRGNFNGILITPNKDLVRLTGEFNIEQFVKK